MTFIKTHIKNILLIVFFIIFLIFCIKGSLKYKERFETGLKTTGIIKKGFQTLNWSYYVDSVLYNGINSLNSNNFLVNGEEYYVYYDKNDITSSSVCLTEPYIDKTKFDSVYSLPLTIKLGSGTELIEFKFKYKNELRKRSHLVYLENNFYVKKKKFKVFVNKSNPKISYINLME
jgi:hypothetical protein